MARKGVWTYAQNHAEVIAGHWKLALAANPQFFNGIIHVMRAMTIEGDHAEAEFIATEFKNFLYWRDEGFPAEARMRDGFGSALIRARDGSIVLGRQRAGNINAGLAYLPGGFIDARDVLPSGEIDVRASIDREVREETGLGAGDIEAEPGFLVAEVAAHVSFAVAYRSEFSGEEIAARISAHIAADPNSELVGAVVVRSPAGLEGLAMPHYARVLLASPLAWSRD
jgi:8-oxo-dGTP pyrophosphatase MutT (NUDIX family)